MLSLNIKKLCFLKGSLSKNQNVAGCLFSLPLSFPYTLTSEATPVLFFGVCGEPLVYGGHSRKVCSMNVNARTLGSGWEESLLPYSKYVIFTIVIRNIANMFSFKIKYNQGIAVPCSAT